jgi:hypothetical protein
MILPPGGFLTLGVLLLGLAWWGERRARRTEARAGRVLRPEAVAAAGVALADSAGATLRASRTGEQR